VTADRFRQAMRRWATGVSVLTLRDGNEVRGITISSFTSVSLEPPLVLACIDRRARIHDAVLRCARFAISVLAAGQDALADRFAGRPGAVAAPVRFAFTPRGTPYLPVGLAWFDCSRVAAHEAGDHTIIIARVNEARVAGGCEPLLYVDGGYAGVQHPVSGSSPRERVVR